MSSTPQHWLRIYEYKRTIYAAMKEPISIQEIADKTGIDYATIHNTMKQLVRWADVKALPKQNYADYKRIHYIATKDEYTETIPNHVTNYLNKDEPVANVIAPNVRRIVFDESTQYGKDLCKKLVTTWGIRRANSKAYVSGSTLA